MTPRAGLAVLVFLAAAAGCASHRVLATDATPPVVASTAPEPVTLRVGLVEHAGKVVLTADGPCEVRTGARRRPVLVLGAGRSLTVRRLDEGLRWSAGTDGGLTESVVVAPLAGGAALRWEDGAWRGALQAIPTPGGRGVTLVNEVDLESYLRGVVPAEIGRPEPAALAAVEAQAVAARTYALAYRGTRASRGFDLYADVRDQVYLGVAGEHATADAAVAGTAGLALTVDGRPVNAYYHANCGGCSEVPDAVWPRPAEDYLVVCEDRAFAQGACFCADGRHHSWREEWSAADLARGLRATLPAYLDWVAERPERAAWAGEPFTPRAGSDGRTPGALRDLRVRERTTSGRVAWLDVETDAGTYHVRGDRARWVLAPASGEPAILRSAWFDLDVARQEGRIVTVAADGRGFGHGIGMCQHGALARARAGQDVRAILAHYYPGATVTALGGAAAP